VVLNYQVPVLKLFPERRTAHSHLRWLGKHSRLRWRKILWNNVLAKEIMDAANNSGAAVKKTEENTLKVA